MPITTPNPNAPAARDDAYINNYRALLAETVNLARTLLDLTSDDEGVAGRARGTAEAIYTGEDSSGRRVFQLPHGTADARDTRDSDNVYLVARTEPLTESDGAISAEITLSPRVRVVDSIDPVPADLQQKVAGLTPAGGTADISSEFPDYVHAPEIDAALRQASLAVDGVLALLRAAAAVEAGYADSAAPLIRALTSGNSSEEFTGEVEVSERDGDVVLTVTPRLSGSRYESRDDINHGPLHGLFWLNASAVLSPRAGEILRAYS